ncbi:MAG: serine/threonine-protein kinase [Nannocystaceae bacterium]
MSLSSNRPGGPATAPRVPESSSDPLIGQTLGGKYAVVRLIGRGGVGLVYLARHAERDVVVKVLSPHWADDAEALARFDREAKRLAGLHHPNVVEMLDFGRDGDRAYLVMEYLRGELLSDFVSRKRRLSLEEFVPIAAQILKGIGHAHSREVMVRDVKPANIMLCERKGRANFVKILDFGLAKLLRGEQAITEEHVMGTVGYLAPEAIRGEPLDLRVDVYAIGVLFYYMLAGRLPFEGESNAAVFYKTIHEPPRPLGEVVGAGAALPPGLIELVHQCLEKDREQRPADADRVVERLIDVVPASLFRLPRTTTERHGGPVVVPPGVGNTGLIELLGNGRNETVLEPRSMTPIPGTLRPVVSVTPEPATATATSANENHAHHGTGARARAGGPAHDGPGRGLGGGRGGAHGAGRGRGRDDAAQRRLRRPRAHGRDRAAKPGAGRQRQAGTVAGGAARRRRREDRPR